MKKELQKILKIHGIPKRLQSDNGGEFKKEVKRFWKINKIKMIRPRRYSLESQGKVERSHQVHRRKIYYDLVQKKKSGVNWLKNWVEDHADLPSDGMSSRSREEILKSYLFD